MTTFNEELAQLDTIQEQPKKYKLGPLANLRPHPPFQKGSQEAKELGRKGGLSKSPRKAMSAKLRYLREQGATTQELQELYDLMSDGEYSAFDILHVLQEWKKNIPPSNIGFYLKMRMDWHKLHHGTKETHQTIDVTSKEYKFNIEVVQAHGTSTPVEGNTETVPSISVTTR